MAALKNAGQHGHQLRSDSLIPDLPPELVDGLFGVRRSAVPDRDLRQVETWGEEACVCRREDEL